MRQQFVESLIAEVGVPDDMLTTEDAVSHYVRRGKGRADILAFARSDDGQRGQRLLVVECKGPQASLNDDVLDQASRYARKLDAPFVFLTNGRDTHAYRVRQKQPERLFKVPTYDDMMEDKDMEVYEPDPWKRPAWTTLRGKSRRELRHDPVLDVAGARQTPDSHMHFVAELNGLLRDEVEPMGRSVGSSESSLDLEDIGLSHLAPGNRSGNTWDGRYRSFVVNTGGSPRVVSLAILEDLDERPILCVATDRKGGTGNALQLDLGKYVEIDGHTALVWHDGRMRGGLKGGSKQAMVDHVRQSAPHLIDGGYVLLGELRTDRRITWRALERFLLNCIEYGLLREQFTAELEARH